MAPERLSCRVLLMVAAATVSVSAQTFINYSGGGGHVGAVSSRVAVGSSDPCSPSPCGPNTRCSINSRGVGVCRCLDGFFPKPNTIQGCGPQCISDSECGNPRFICRNQKCVDPCVDQNPCGVNANCEVRSHLAVCRCPPGYEGNPYSYCSVSVTGRFRGSATGQAGHRTAVGPAVVGRSSSSSGLVSRGPPAPPTDPCSLNVCGTNARCDSINGRAVCSCPAGYQGDPLTACRRGECTQDSDCPLSRACIDVTCQDPCARGVCGSGAECNVENHRAICSCPQNYIGDPFVSCRYDPGPAGGAQGGGGTGGGRFPGGIQYQAACTPSPCGQNTNCKVQNGRAVCSCIQNYIGNPLTGCRPECTGDTECASHQACVQNRCRNACTDACGQNARCDAVNHRAVCTCPQYYRGSGLTGCYPECTSHDECPSHQACFQLRCSDPCQGACGIGAECNVQNHKAICKCPKGYEGHPFDRCTPAAPRGSGHRTAAAVDGRGSHTGQTPCDERNLQRAASSGDMCSPNPCGTNADCNPGTDNTGSPRPVCTCPRGYLGDPLISCTRGECEVNTDCRRGQACYNYRCTNPCLSADGGNVCGTNALCDAKNHKAVCYCPQEYTGDPLRECRLKPLARSARRFKRFLDGLMNFARKQEAELEE